MSTTDQKTLVELKDQIEKLALKFHQEGGVEASCVEYAHVTQVWYDGEITSTKCGQLLGQRRLILMSQGVRPDSKLMIDEWKPKMPAIQGKHTFAFVSKKEEAEELQKLINQLATALDA